MALDLKMHRDVSSSGLGRLQATKEACLKEGATILFLLEVKSVLRLWQFSQIGGYGTQNHCLLTVSLVPFQDFTSVVLPGWLASGNGCFLPALWT